MQALLVILASIVAAGPAAGLVIRAAPDTILSATESFRTDHEILLHTFATAMQRAVAPSATQYERASLVLFLRVELMPHARAEEEVLYPAVDSVLGTRGYATATMVLDHRAIARLVDDLAALARSPDPTAFKRRAYAIDALVESHFAKEERFILPILRERISEPELRALFIRMGEHEVQ